MNTSKKSKENRVHFDVPSLPLNNFSDLDEVQALEGSSILGELGYEDFAYGGSKSARASRLRRPPKNKNRDPGAPLTARDLGMSREFPGKIVRIKPKFPKPFNKFKHYEKVRQLDKKNRVHPQFMASQQQYDDPWEREIKRMRHARIRQVGDRPFHVTPHHRSVMMREQRLAQSNCSSHGPYMPSQVISATGKWEPHKTKHKWLGQAWKAPNRMQRAPGE